MSHLHSFLHANRTDNKPSHISIINPKGKFLLKDEDLNDMSDTHDEADSAATGSSSKKSKVTTTGGGKLLNKKVRIHKAKSISQKTISGEKKKKITKVIKNKELLSIKKSRAKPTKAMRLG